MQQQQTLPTHPAFASRKVLILAIILGVVAAGLIVAFLSSRKSSPGTAVPVTTVQVIVATQDIPSGTKITNSMVALKAVQQDAVVADPLTALTAVTGKTARYPIAKGAQLSGASIVAPAASKALSFEIPPGKRGFTVAVSPDTSPAALMVPGDFVDVLLAGTRESAVSGGAATPVATPAGTSSNPPKAAVTLIQNVQVLSVQTTYVDNGVPYNPSVRGSQQSGTSTVSNVTLAVTPDQAQLLWLASQDGKITLSLRGFGDEGTAVVPPVAEPIEIPAGGN